MAFLDKARGVHNVSAALKEFSSAGAGLDALLREAGHKAKERGPLIAALLGAYFFLLGLLLLRMACPSGLGFWNLGSRLFAVTFGSALR